MVTNFVIIIKSWVGNKIGNQLSVNDLIIKFINYGNSFSYL